MFLLLTEKNTLLQSHQWHSEAAITVLHRWEVKAHHLQTVSLVRIHRHTITMQSQWDEGLVCVELSGEASELCLHSRCFAWGEEHFLQSPMPFFQNCADHLVW